ncbi:hypothetical protein O5D80_008619 [Batrachochytrium dendrobatidis]|nr:hypothetical protein O5D80_008619 [Batrachochytrium dendrobatidis]
MVPDHEGHPWAWRQLRSPKRLGRLFTNQMIDDDLGHSRPFGQSPDD